MNYKKTVLVTLGVLVVLIAGFFIFKQRYTTSLVSTNTGLNATTSFTGVSTEPQKTDFGVSVPTDFPTDIPIENGAKVEQSYSLNYVGQKQLTIVILSVKTVNENYSLYADFLKLNGWNVSNKYESPKLSSLYGTKENNDINVTISENSSASSVKSQVSISILKK